MSGDAIRFIIESLLKEKGFATTKSNIYLIFNYHVMDQNDQPLDQIINLHRNSLEKE